MGIGARLPANSLRSSKRANFGGSIAVPNDFDSPFRTPVSFNHSMCLIMGGDTESWRHRTLSNEPVVASLK